MNLSREEFLTLIDKATPQIHRPDDQQEKAVFEESDANLFIVAGPGTGKTACLTYRSLYLIFVAGLRPDGILATTFTKKAAAELRSRILGWGYRIIDAARSVLPADRADALRAIDLNQIRTGTIDSICESILREHRAPGEEPPILADEYFSQTVLVRDGLLSSGLYRNNALDGWLLQLRDGTRYGYDIAAKARMLRGIGDRRHNDLIKFDGFVSSGPRRQRKGRKAVLNVFDNYDAAMAEAGVMDFAQLERKFGDGLQVGGYRTFTKSLQAILVDEYQDTNLLQEFIYYGLAKESGAPLTVVGDDDQSLFRFRGATVELFSNFPKRLRQTLKRQTKSVFLTRNYRSTKRIVNFVATYGTLDSKYQQVRVRGKPKIEARAKAPDGAPVLAMFRDDVDILARDLAAFLYAIFRGNGHQVGRKRITVGRGGNIGDAALLSHSPREDGEKKLPGVLRRELLKFKHPIELFNPRGEDFSKIPIVQRFGGLLLECLDSSGSITGPMRSVSNNAKATFRNWRDAATDMLNKRGATDLRRYVDSWRRWKRGRQWPSECSAIDLVYALRHWFTEFQTNSEQQVYFEIFARQLTAAEELGSFSGRVIFAREEAWQHVRSVEHLIRDFLAPIADGSVGLNEELVDAFPRNKLPVLSIHQSKGLEFPLVIVDVGSRFKVNHRLQKRSRFPEGGDLSHRLEDEFRLFSPLGVPRRKQTDRAFDDLCRLYYVAFSRPRDVLLLVGLTKSMSIPNVAQGWTRDGIARWNTNPPWTII